MRGQLAQLDPLKRLPEHKWPKKWRSREDRPVTVWVSERFQATLWHENATNLVLSVNLRERDDKLTFKDGIKWDELQVIKSLCGFGEWQAVEIYPPDSEVVYNANVRHLWLMHHPLNFQWRKKP